jgi:hypothetical protein
MGHVVLPALSEHSSSEVSLVLSLALESCSGATSEAWHVLGLDLGNFVEYCPDAASSSVCKGET